MERAELEKCIAIAKARFSDQYYPEAARSWADMDFTDVKDYLENAIPETIKLRGLSGYAIKQRIKQIKESERQRNEECYGLRMTDAELEQHQEEYLEAQRDRNERIWNIRCTNDELFFNFWEEVLEQVEGEKK